MGGCCCCFAHKPPRENPMHPGLEPLIRGGSSAAGHHHPAQMVTYSEGLGAAERLRAGFRTFKRTIYDKNPILFGTLKSGQSPKVKCIVVIGHSCCGGIRELLSLKEDRPQTYHCIDNWVKIGLAIKKKVEREHASLSFDDKCTMLEFEAVNLSLRNLATYPFVKDKLGKGTLKLIGARYDFVHGSFQTWHA
ncbi:unnamed protein product [Urochloa humidicola]